MQFSETATYREKLSQAIGVLNAQKLERLAFHRGGSGVGWTQFELFKLLAEVEGTLWRPDEGQGGMWDARLASNEGRGEKALKTRRGMPLDATNKPGDLDDDSDVKDIDDKSAKGSLRSLRIGAGSWRAWKLARSYALEDQLFRHLRGTKLHDRVCLDDLPTNILELLPNDAMAVIAPTLDPRVTIDHPALMLCTRHGFISVLKRDYGAAFKFAGAGTTGMCYRLRSEYVRDRLLGINEPAASPAHEHGPTLRVDPYDDPEHTSS